MLKAFNLTLMVLFSATMLMAEKLPKPTLVPSTPTLYQRTLTADGVTYHDAGRYDDAIAKYKEALEAAPDNVQAIYEMAYSFRAKRDCPAAMRLARRGAEYRSELLPQFHLILGNCLDDLGKPKEAIRMYQHAIKVSPKFALLYFNLGLAQVRLKKNLDAQNSLQQALLLNPNHAPTHYLLARVYNELGYRVPAVLALSCFLMLEPESRRADESVHAITQLLSSGVTQEIDGVRDVSPFQRLTAVYAVMADVLLRTRGRQFAVNYYAPFFAEMEKKQFVEPFVYRAFTAAELRGSEEWAKDSEAKLTEYDAWLKEYRWPVTK